MWLAARLKFEFATFALEPSIRLTLAGNQKMGIAARQNQRPVSQSDTARMLWIYWREGQFHRYPYRYPIAGHPFAP